MRDQLDGFLAENDRRAKRERLTLVRIYEELRNLGYDGSYDAVRRYAATWSRATREATASAYVSLSFDPGEAYQFDWSHEIVLNDGVTTTVKVAHVRLSHSRMPYVRAYPRESEAASAPPVRAQGRCHLAVSIARACIRTGRRGVRHGLEPMAPFNGSLFDVVDLVNKLDAEARAERQGRTAELISRLDFLILDGEVEQQSWKDP